MNPKTSLSERMWLLNTCPFDLNVSVYHLRRIGIKDECIFNNINKFFKIRDKILTVFCLRLGEKFVILASQRLRATALFGCRQVDPDALMTINDIKFAILERIGRYG